MIIYESNTNDFTYNGKGYLNDVINASIVDTLNGDYSLSFEYPMNAKLNEYLVEGNYVKCKVADGSMQIFMITNVVKTFDTLKVQAKHIFYKLLYNFLEDVYPQNLNCQDFLRWILSHTQYNNEFTGYSNITGTFQTARYIRKNPVEAIIGDEDNSMYKLFGGELKRDNFDIYFNNRIGNDEGVKLIFGKNITGININIDNTNCYTRIMPLGYDALMLPEKYIDSDLINNYPFPRIAIYKFEDVKYDPNDEEAYHTLADAYQALRNKVEELYDAGIDKPQVNMTIDWLELSKTSQYKDYAALERVHLGDTIYANILGVEFETRVVKTTYNPLTDTIEKFEIGTIKPTIATSMNNIVRTLENVSPDSILTQAQQNATQLITQAMGGYVYKTNSELYIMDTNDPNTAEKVWRWNINGLGYSSTGINGPYGIAMTMDGAIVADFITTGTLNTNVIQGYDNLVISVSDATQQVAALSLTVAELNSKIQDVLDITTSAESDTGYVELFHINNSEPIMVQIHPINVDITNLYPRNTLYPSNSLYPHNAILRFTNVDTSEVFDYYIPVDLLYLNSDVYDTFYLSYDENICQVVHKVGINQQGQKYELPTPITETFTYPAIMLTTGDEYHIELLGMNSAYLFVRLMTANIYTTQFATRTELTQTADTIRTEVSREYATKDEMTSSITQTADAINLEVSKKVGKTEVISSINQSAEAITINANKISLEGKTISLTSENINIASNNFSVDKYGNVNAANITATGGSIGNCQIVGGNLQIPSANISGTLSANKINGGTLNGNYVDIKNLNASNIIGGSLQAGEIDYEYNTSTGLVYFKCGPAFGLHPTISGLEVGSFGVWPRDPDVGLYLGICKVQGRFFNSPVEGASGNFAFGNWHGTNYINADNGDVRVQTASNKAFYINGVQVGGTSDRNAKENIKELTNDDKEKLLQEIRELPTYSYDFKEDYGGQKDNLGIIIQDFENNDILGKTLHITEYKGIKKYNHEDLSQIDLILIKTLLEKIDKLEEEIKQLKEDK